MAGVSRALLSDLPDEVGELLATAPVTEKKFLELGVAWRELSPTQARMADVLRVFVVTWDPLELLAGRPAGFATANAAASGLDELVVYAPVWSLVELATEQDVTLAAVLGSMAGSAVVTAAAHEQSVIEGRYPDLVVAQEAPTCSPTPQPVPRSVRSTCGSCPTSGRTSGSARSPTSSSTHSALLISTARWSSSWPAASPPGLPGVCGPPIRLPGRAGRSPS